MCTLSEYLPIDIDHKWKSCIATTSSIFYNSLINSTELTFFGDPSIKTMKQSNITYFVVMHTIIEKMYVQIGSAIVNDG
jgi:hypothetical protein